jgi:hypothetical protein
VPIAIVLTLLARAALGAANVPAIVTESNVRGAGKGKTNDCAVIIATGRAAAKGTYPDKPDELEKVLGACALEGASIVAFDNVEGVFGGGSIERIITCGGRTALRVLGLSRRPELQWRASIIATANNIEITTDMGRRVLVARIEHPDEHPEARAESSYRHHPLEPWVVENRARLVVAALTILRAWHIAGRPRMACPSWGSFEEWAAMVPPAIVFAGGADPMGCRIPESADRTKLALDVLLRDWPRLGGPEGISARDAIDALYPQSRLRGEALPDSYADLREAIEHFAPAAPGKAPSTHRFGCALRRAHGRVVAGRRLIADPARHSRWRVESV